jgi:polar amino acid transport system permease protein
MVQYQRIPFLRNIVSFYIELSRNTPLLAQLFFLYFGLPKIGISISAEGCAIIGLTFLGGSYMTEALKSGLESVDKIQGQSALSLGMNYGQTMRYVILPQAIRVILPPVGNDFISLLKDSSLVSVVSVADMTRRGREFMAAQFLPIETWVMVAFLYLVMTLFAARVVTWLERSTRLER